MEKPTTREIVDAVKAKKLGRQVKNFDQDAWNAVSYDIMLRGCLQKYAQNKVLFDKITDPALAGKKFVEASPVDGIWGIKLGEGDCRRNLNGHGNMMANCTFWKEKEYDARPSN